VATASKPEFPPLLPVGLHPKTLPELRQMCVTNFPLSTRRDPIMRSVEAMCTSISTALIRAEMWIDGSFLTQKIEPDDVDLLVTLDAQYLSGTPLQQQIVSRIASQDFKAPVQCDSYVHFQYPEGHASYWTAEFTRAYWMRQFGFGRNDQFKGLAVIRTPIA
jgi:hypothetical protein